MASQWILIPYDDSPVARAALHQASHSVRTSGGVYAGILLATTGVDPAALDALTSRALEAAGREVPVDVCLLDPGDPLGALDRLIDGLPDVTLAAPLHAAGNAPWYAEACALGGKGHPLMLFFLPQKEIAKFQEDRHERHRVGGPVGAVLHACARVRPGMRAPVKGGVL